MSPDQPSVKHLRALGLPSDPRRNARQLISALLEPALPDLWLELRLIVPVSRVVQRFCRAGTLQGGRWGLPALDHWDGKANVYYSIVPRLRQRGTAVDCGPALAAWADFDLGLPGSFPLPPSVMVESSPGKYQALWFLVTPCDDLSQVEALNRAIASTLGADIRACDRARVLRLPGFKNLKYPNRPLARLRECNCNLRYSISDLELAYPPSIRAIPGPATRNHSGTAPAWLVLVFEAVINYLEQTGHRLVCGRDGGITTTCPLHDDHNPSLSLHPERGWKCFAGCGQGRLTALAARLGIKV